MLYQHQTASGPFLICYVLIHQVSNYVISSLDNSTHFMTKLWAVCFVPLFIKFIGVTLANEMYRFQAHDSATHHLYTVLCVLHPKSRLLPPPFTPHTFLHLPLPTRKSPHCCQYPWNSFSLCFCSVYLYTFLCFPLKISYFLILICCLLVCIRICRAVYRKILLGMFLRLQHKV